jgi:hypothetical protein
MNQALTDLFQRKQKQLPTGEGIDWDSRRNEYLVAVDDLYKRIESMLAEPIGQKSVTLHRRPKQLTENYIGTYSADDLILVIGEERRGAGSLLAARQERRGCRWACRRDRRAWRGDADRRARRSVGVRANSPADVASRAAGRVNARRGSADRDARLKAMPLPSLDYETAEHAQVIVGRYRECLRVRHWLGHGRFWAKPAEVDRFDPDDVYDRANVLLQAMPP